MGDTVLRHLWPLTVLATLCCFYTVVCRNAMLRNTVLAYCCVTSLFHFALCTVYLWRKTYTLEITYVGVAFTILDAVSMLILTYYRIKYIRQADLYSSIFENISYVDRYIEDVVDRGRVSRAKYKIVINIYLTVSEIVQIYGLCVSLETYKLVFAGEKKLLFDVDTTYMTLMKFLFTLSTIPLTHEFLYVLYTLHQCVGSLCRAVDSVEIFDAKKIAWVTNSVYTMDSTKRDNTLIRKLTYLKSIQSACTALHNAYCTVKMFYSCFVSYLLIVTVFVGIGLVLSKSAGMESIFHICLVLRLIEMEIGPIVLCTAIRFKLRKIHSIFENYYYMNKSNLLKRKLENCVQHFMFSSIQFDCGFFELDYYLLWMALDFILLFVFAILS